MDLQADDLVLFAHVMEAGSFAQAAERVGLPKSTVSRRITMLEQRLGERLLTRSTRWLVITDFGACVLEHARRLRMEMEGVAALAPTPGAGPRGRLRVAGPLRFTEDMLAPVLMDFVARYPQVDVNLHVSPQPVDPLRDKFDLVVRVAPRLPDDDTLVARALCVMHGGLFASPEYVARHGMPATPWDLEQHICLQFCMESFETMPWVLQSGNDTYQRTPAGAFGSNSVDMICAAAVNGRGIAPLPEGVGAKYVAQGVLVHLLPEWRSPPITVWAVTPGRHFVPVRTRVLLDLLVTALQQPHTCAVPSLQ